MSRINAPPIPATVITSTSPGAITANPFPLRTSTLSCKPLSATVACAERNGSSTTSPATAFVAILFIIV